MNITIITYRDQDIELATTKDEIKWTIQRGNNKYGKGAIIPSKKLEDIAGVMGTIIINAIETIQILDENEKLNQCQKKDSNIQKKAKKK